MANANNAADMITSAADLQSTITPSLLVQRSSNNSTDKTSSQHASNQLTGNTVAEELASDKASHVQPTPDVSSNDAAVTTTSQPMTQAEETVCDVSQSRGGGKLKPKRIKRRVTGNRTCTVCGDHAIAHNFGALTCETCKAFFRRNASKAQEIPACAFNQTCVITKVTRRFCACCRMAKCFAVGMDPLLILDEEDRKALQTRKRGKQKQQNETHVQSDTCTSTVPIPVDCPPTSCHPLTSPGHPALPTAEAMDVKSNWSSLMLTFNSADPTGRRSDSITTQLISHDSTAEGVTASCSSKDTSEAGQSTTKATTTNCTGQMFESFLAQGRRFRHVEREQLPWDMKMYWLLREEERSLLTTLTNTFTNIQMTLKPPEPSDDFNPDKPFCLDSLMFILDATLRKCVHFAKTIPDFKGLPEADQITILKASALETYALRSAALFIVEREAWHSYLGDLKLQDIKKIFEDHDSTDVFANYCAAMKSVVKTNSTIYAMLHCIILFDVRNTKLEDYGKVSVIQDKYLVLLKHYLQSEFSYLHASRYLAELMALLEDMHNLHHKIVFFYKKFSSFFRPLISEFFTT
ncbi:hypothetical protein ACOMHN_047685 [Nucella lapillus]